MSDDIDEDFRIKKRSERMVNLFNAFKNKNLGNLPVPPFSKFLNGKLIVAKRGEIELEFEVRPEFANPTGLLHGGMECALMDDVIGMTTATLGYEGFLISIDLQVNYLGKAKVGNKVRIKAAIVREGHNVVHAFAQIFDADGNLIATGNSNLLKTHYTPDYVKFVDQETPKN